MIAPGRHVNSTFSDELFTDPTVNSGISVKVLPAHIQDRLRIATLNDSLQQVRDVVSSFADSQPNLARFVINKAEDCDFSTLQILCER